MNPLNPPPEDFNQLTRREQQIMSVVYKLKSASTQQVVDGIPDKPGYSSVRKIMENMVSKRLLTYRKEGTKYVYEPILPVSQAQSSALLGVVKSLFGNSPASAIAAMLRSRDLSISPDELDELQKLIARESAKNKKS